MLARFGFGVNELLGARFVKAMKAKRGCVV
jgi:hypothetical protein